MPQSSSAKRVKRLSGWHRIGITVSILWLFFGAFWGYKVGDLEGTRTIVYWRSDCRGKYGSAVESPPSKAPVTAYDATGAPTTLDMSTFSPDDVDGIPVKSPPPIPSITDKYGGHLLLDPDQQERLVEAYQRADDWCDQQSQQLWPAVHRKIWTYTALYALVPIVLGWLTAYGIIALVRWIRTGFKVPTSPN
jgi:hypothetical protein